MRMVLAFTALLLLQSAAFSQSSYRHVSGDIKYFDTAPASFYNKTIVDKVDKAIAAYKKGGLLAVEQAFPQNQTSPTYVAIVDEQGRYIFGNRKAGEAANRQRKAILGKDIVDPKLASVFKHVKKGPVWIRLNWVDPESNIVLPKIDYLKYYDGKIFSSGYYRAGAL